MRSSTRSPTGGAASCASVSGRWTARSASRSPTTESACPTWTAARWSGAAGRSWTPSSAATSPGRSSISPPSEAPASGSPSAATAQPPARAPAALARAPTPPYRESTDASRLSADTASSIGRKVPLDLPVVDLGDVLLPLLLFRRDEMVEHVVPQDAAHDLVLLHEGDRLAQIAGQLLDPVLPVLANRELGDVLVDRLGGLDLPPDPVQPGAELDGQCEVGIRRRVRHAQLEARALSAPGRNA